MKTRNGFGNFNIFCIVKDFGEFYVYAYYDPRKDPPEIFYIGKGKGGRYKVHLCPSMLKKGHNIIKRRKLNAILKEGLTPEIIKLKEFLTEEQAYKLEQELIEEFGTIINKTGPLTNVYINGAYKNGMYKPISGKSNHLNRMSFEEREEFLNRYRRGENNPSYGRPKTQRQIEAIRKVGLEGKGRKHTEETKRKMSINGKGKITGEKNPNYGKKGSDNHCSKSLIIIFPDGSELLTKCIKDFCRST